MKGLTTGANAGLADKPRQPGTPEPIAGAPTAQTTDYLIFEVWREARPYVKDLLVEIMIFAVALGGLELFVWQVRWGQLSDLQKEILDAVHFWTFFFVFVIFGLSFIIQVWRRGMRQAFGEDA